MSSHSASPSAVIIGSGYIANRHAAALRDAGIPLAGIFSPTSGNAAAAAQRWGTTPFDTIAEALNARGATHVHVCSPTTSHEELVLAALAANRTVVCEKPLSTDRQSAARLVAAGRAAAGSGFVTFNRRFDDGILRMRSLLSDGAIGAPVAVYGQYQQEWNASPSTRDWRFDPAAVGPSRVVSEIGSHWLDLAEFVTADSISAVCALTASMGEREFRQGSESGRFTPVNEDLFSSLLRFAGGAVGTVTATQLAHGSWDDITLRIDGTTGSLDWTSATPNRVTHHVKGAGSTSYGDGGPTRSIETMIASIYHSDDTPCARFDDGEANCAVQDAVLSSARTNNWTDVEKTV